MRCLSLLVFATLALACATPEPSQDDGGESTDGGSEESETETETETGTEPEIDCEALELAVAERAVAYRELHTLAGLGISVHAEGCEPWSRAWGVANIASESELSTDYLLRAASVTKSFVAALVLRLSEDQLLSLDDTPSQWGMNFAGSSEITLRQLLKHTSGLADYQDNPDFQAAAVADPDRVWDPQELIDYALALDPVGAPGELHDYANVNYLIAARVVELATGQPIHEVLRARVIEPAGLVHTYFEGGEQWTVEEFATGYYSEDMGPAVDVTPYFHISQAWAAGAIVTTVDELRVWMETLLTTDFLGPDSQAELIDFVPAGPLDGYGLGVFWLDADGLTIVGHNGLLIGFASAAFYHPGSGATVGVMHNQLNLDTLDKVFTADPIVLAAQIVDEVVLAGEGG